MKLIIATSPKDQVHQLAETLVEEELVACVNIVDTISSVYKWQGKVVKDTESFLVMKTAESRLPALQERFHELHPYDVPEYLVLGVDLNLSSAAYMNWVHQTTAQSQ